MFNHDIELHYASYQDLEELEKKCLVVDDYDNLADLVYHINHENQRKDGLDGHVYIIKDFIARMLSVLMHMIPGIIGGEDK